MTYLCYVQTPSSTVAHLEPVLADDWPAAAAEIRALMRRHSRPISARVFKNDALVAMIDSPATVPNAPLASSAHPLVTAMPVEALVFIATEGVSRNVMGGKLIAADNEILFILAGAVGQLGGVRGPCLEVFGPGDFVTRAQRKEGPLMALADARYVAVDSARLEAVLPSGRLGAMQALQHRSRLSELQKRIVCTAWHDTTSRLATWLVLLRTLAAPGEPLRLKQSDMAIILGVQRTTANAGFQKICTSGAIRVMRGVVQVLDRHALEQAACPCGSGAKDDR